MDTISREILIAGMAPRLSVELRMLARALANGVIVIDAQPAKLPAIEELVVKIPKDFALPFIELKPDREPWRRGRPLR